LDSVLRLINDTEKLVEIGFKLAENGEEILNLGYAAVHGDGVGAFQIAVRMITPKLIKKLV
jgi:hypothetical protein